MHSQYAIMGAGEEAHHEGKPSQLWSRMRRWRSKSSCITAARQVVVLRH